MTELQQLKSQWLSRARPAQQKLLALQAIDQQTDLLIQSAHCPEFSSYIHRLQLYFQEQILSLLAIQEEIRCQIDTIPDMQLQTILIRRYLLHETMEQIAEAMFYDLRTIQRKHLQALDMLSLPISETTIFPDISCEN